MAGCWRGRDLGWHCAPHITRCPSPACRDTPLRCLRHSPLRPVGRCHGNRALAAAQGCGVAMETSPGSAALCSPEASSSPTRPSPPQLAGHLRSLSPRTRLYAVPLRPCAQVALSRPCCSLPGLRAPGQGQWQHQPPPPEIEPPRGWLLPLASNMQCLKGTLDCVLLSKGQRGLTVGWGCWPGGGPRNSIPPAAAARGRCRRGSGLPLDKAREFLQGRAGPWGLGGPLISPILLITVQLFIHPPPGTAQTNMGARDPPTGKVMDMGT